MKEKVYALTKKMESDGWDLIILNSFTSISGNVEWYAILRKDGISVYIELENEKNLWMRDISLECPKCGRAYDQDGDEDFCVDCGAAWDYKKEIPADYK